MSVDTTVSLVKADEPIDTLFGLWTRMGARNHALNGCADPPRGEILGVVSTTEMLCKRDI